MIIFFFTILFLIVFLLTKSYQYVEKYYPTIMYVSFISIIYELVCTDYGMWQFPIWWIFTDQACALLQACILFPTTTVIFLRYLPRNKWGTMLYFVFFMVLYVAMEWAMRMRHEIRYSHGWEFGWSAVLDVLLFLMIWLHEHDWKLTWLVTVGIIIFLLTWFNVPLFVLGHGGGVK